jgi:hypothetical protein
LGAAKVARAKNREASLSPLPPSGKRGNRVFPAVHPPLILAAHLGAALWCSRNNFGEKPERCDDSFAKHWNYPDQKPI